MPGLGKAATRKTESIGTGGKEIKQKAVPQRTGPPYRGEPLSVGQLCMAQRKESLLHVDDDLHGGLPVFVDVLVGLQVLLEGKVFGDQGFQLHLALVHQVDGG